MEHEEKAMEGNGAVSISGGIISFTKIDKR